MLARDACFDFPACTLVNWLIVNPAGLSILPLRSDKEKTLAPTSKAGNAVPSASLPAPEMAMTWFQKTILQHVDKMKHPLRIADKTDCAGLGIGHGSLLWNLPDLSPLNRRPALLKVLLRVPNLSSDRVYCDGRMYGNMNHEGVAEPCNLVGWFATKIDVSASSECASRALIHNTSSVHED